MRFLLTIGIEVCMTDTEANAFYHTYEWTKKRAEVLKLDHNECQRCKANGRYTKATTVHHVKHLKDRPDLALSIWDGNERQLVSLCQSCHNLEHPEKASKGKRKEVITKEFW